MNRVLLLLALLLTASCRPAAPACPSPATLEMLHAATFEFEHGQPSRGRSALQQARTLASSTEDAQLKQILERLARVDSTADQQLAAMELENIRLIFRDWTCLPEDLHQQFHQALPPLR